MPEKGEYVKTKCPKCLGKLIEQESISRYETCYKCEKCGFVRVIYK